MCGIAGALPVCRKSLSRVQLPLWLSEPPYQSWSAVACISMCTSCESRLSADVACHLTVTSHPVSLPALLFFSSRLLPVAACLGLGILEEGEASSAAWAGNPARTQPTKTPSARPAEASDLQPPQVSGERASQPLFPQHHCHPRGCQSFGDKCSKERKGLQGPFKIYPRAVCSVLILVF